MKRLLPLLLASLPGLAMAGTYVYVSNAEDGDIGVYALRADGSLQPAARVPVAKLVMPMAVSPDRKRLYAVVRAKPYTAHAFTLDPTSGALQPISAGTLAESFPYVSTDRTGRWLFGASYGGHIVDQPLPQHELYLHR